MYRIALIITGLITLGILINSDLGKINSNKCSYVEQKYNVIPNNNTLCPVYNNTKSKALLSIETSLSMAILLAQVKREEEDKEPSLSF